MNDHINIIRLRSVANILSAYREQIVFVGGATLSLYASRPELTSIRSTDDVDVVVELVTTGDFYLLQQQLLSLGFTHDTNAPILSRFLYQGLKVDFMPTDPSILGFTNRWYKEGIQQKIEINLGEQVKVYIFSAPYFLASKMEAFLGRGKSDLFASHDLEDMVYVLDHRPTILEEIRVAPQSVRTYLVEHFNNLMKNSLFEEALLGHVEQQNALERVKRILLLLKEMIRE